MYQIIYRTMPEVWEDALAKYGDMEALVYRSQRFTRREWNRNINKMTNALYKLGVRKGDKVVYSMPVTPEWTYVWLGVAFMGAVVVPINMTWKALEYRDALKRCDVHTFVFMDKFRGVDYIPIVKETIPGLEGSKPGELHCPELPNLKNVICLSRDHNKYDFAYDFYEIHAQGADYVESLIHELRSAVKPDDPANLMLTSGTTAFPKPAINTHRTWASPASLTDMPAYFGLNWVAERTPLGQPIRFLLMVPNWHNSASLLLGLSMATRLCLHLVEFFEPTEVLETIEREKIQHSFGFGLHYRMVAAHPRLKDYDLSSFNITATGHDPGDYDTIKDVIGIEHQLNIYGITEAGTITVGLLPPESTKDPYKLKYSYGRVPTWIDVKVKDPETREELPVGQIGEICIKGPYIFSGYYGMEEEYQKLMDEEGYFHTEDIGHLDDENFIYWDGRLKDVVKSGGENVSALEVEKFLETECPYIRTAVVVGVPDHKWQEAVTAVVSLKPEHEKEGKLSSQDIITWCKGRIAGYKAPKNVIILGHKEMEQYFLLLGKRNKSKIKPLALERLGIEEK